MEAAGTGRLTDEKLIVANFDFLANGTRPTVPLRQAISTLNLFDHAQRFDIWVRDFETDFALPSPYGLSPGARPISEQYDELIGCMLGASGEEAIRHVVLQLLFKKWSLDSREEAVLTFEAELSTFGGLLGSNLPFLEALAREHFGIGVTMTDEIAKWVNSISISAPRLPASDRFNAMAPIFAARFYVAGIDTPTELPTVPFGASAALLGCLNEIDAAYRRIRARIVAAMRAAEVEGYDGLSELGGKTVGDCIGQYRRMYDVADATAPDALFHNSNTPSGRLNDRVRATLLETLEAMRPTAQDVATAKEELDQTKERLINAAAAGSDLPWPGDLKWPGDLSEERKAQSDAEEKLNVARTKFAVRRSAESVKWPVLIRISPENVLAVLTGNTEISLDDVLYRILRGCYQAGKKLVGTAQQKKKTLLAQERPADNVTRPIEDEYWSNRPDPDETCWKYPKIMAATALRKNWIEDDLEYLYLRLFLADATKSIRQSKTSAYSRFGGSAELLVVVYATHAYPPVGFMLDVILGARDVYQALKQYDATSMEYWCSLDPSGSLAEDPPDVYPVLFAYLGIALSAYDIVKLVR